MNFIWEYEILGLNVNIELINWIYYALYPFNENFKCKIKIKIFIENCMA